MTTISVLEQIIVSEGDGHVDVVVKLDAPSNSAISVSYATQNVTAGNADYTGVSGTLNFAAGETTKTVRISIANDSSYVEALEHFKFNLSNANNATISNASANIWIVDNDTKLATGQQPQLFVRDVVVDEQDGTANFVVLLGGVNGVASNSIVKVDYAITGDSATANSDYTGSSDPLTGTLTFAAGETIKVVKIAINNDTIAEGDERFYLNLSNAINATITDGQAVAVIGANDAPVVVTPTISVTEQIVVGEGDGYVDVVVKLNAPSNSAVSVSYTTQNATAGNADYTKVSGTLNFAAGETTKTVRISIDDDSSYVEALEYFKFDLSNANNATIGNASANIWIVDNDTADIQILSYGIGNDVYDVNDDNSLSNILTGNSGNNVLNGGAGADTMIGGKGNDTYYVDNVGDVVTELENEGTDKVLSSISYTLTNHVENLELTGTAHINAIGNSLSNTLTGNSGNNVLNGGVGADTMIGGKGNDTYYVDNVGDVVTELENEGTDKVVSSITYTLTDHVENLELTGTTHINGKGNKLNNIITGNSGNNTLYGEAGNDTLYGGAGNDHLEGGSGNDALYGEAGNDSLYGGSGDDILDGGNGDDLIFAGSGADTIYGGAGKDTLNGDSGHDKIYGGDGDDLINGGSGNDSVWGDAGNDTLNGGSGNDTLNGGDGNDTLTGGSGKDKLYGGAGNDQLYGSSGDDILEGGAGDDELHGGSGNDTLVGGSGNDILNGGNGNDILTGNSGSDTAIYDLLNATHAAGGNGKDTWTDFKVGDTKTDANADKIDFSELLIGYNGNTSTLSGYIKVSQKGNDTIISIDRDGSSNTFAYTDILTLQNVRTDLDTLMNNQQILV